ncbi:dipeptidase D [Chishuiella changwenlii]|uniref:Cytosol non-specific dipeptidase n=1 Tax=Chishuiella changwenlii TaxID=1434701 RepID=A0A1M7CU48_9FLAO|nr:aminoacyl-histidine dipeptidase [Chishuiella changwenlii]GGE96876.1 aminoacyl-histidine dipeptidase [Chishuiella changwenlii]SHL70781.1 dipeptidase D [Chishuiella changwenlii]
MNNDILNLEPKAIWKNFSALNSVPRPSKKEEKVRQFIIKFGEDLGLKVETDEVGNVLIKKSAYPGMEDRKTVVMQSHLDMVCQKNNDVEFDFDTQGIEMYIEDNRFVTANGTTLGADNGIGVATIMAILESKDIPHPAIEAFFTIDEETGMTGALGLKAGFLSGKILLNLDTEEDDELDIGCAGGVDVTATKSYSAEEVNGTAFILTLKGLNGGHSGMQIHEGLGNSNKLIARLLNVGIEYNIHIAHMEGGSLRNAIPRESWAKIVIPTENVEGFKTAFETLQAEIIEEYQTKEPKMIITLEPTEVTNAMSTLDSKVFIQTIMAAYNGVFRMSPDVEGLVETSNNVARVEVIEGKVRVLCLTRSSVESGKEALAQTLKSGFELGGFDVKFSGSYPGWKANTQSEILEIMKAIYIKQNGEEPKVVACHAGLECGIIGTNYPGLDMISFGPNISGAHSPDERVEIVSVQKYWKYLLEILKEIPNDGPIDYSCANSKNK